MRSAKAVLPLGIELGRRQLKKLLPPERFRDSISLGLSVVEEAGYVVRNALDTSLGFSWKLLYGSDYHRRRLSEYRQQKRLLVMVPGYMQSPLSFQRLEQYLGSEPFDVFTYLWGDFPYSQDITISAAQLARVLEEVYCHTTAREIYLLGHSQGGIIIRVMVQHGLAGGLPIRKCLFLSSPHQGTWVGVAAVPHRGVRKLVDLLPYVRKVSGESGVQLLPESPLLSDLNSRPLP
jgi:triacylglycerol esterase/lipase EstA (alpha/beta hydrolase family)